MLIFCPQIRFYQKKFSNFRSTFFMRQEFFFDNSKLFLGPQGSFSAFVAPSKLSRTLFRIILNSDFFLNF